MVVEIGWGQNCTLGDGGHRNEKLHLCKTLWKRSKLQNSSEDHVIPYHVHCRMYFIIVTTLHLA